MMMLNLIALALQTVALPNPIGGCPQHMYTLNGTRNPLFGIISPNSDKYLSYWDIFKPNELNTVKSIGYDVGTGFIYGRINTEAVTDVENAQLFRLGLTDDGKSYEYEIFDIEGFGPENESETQTAGGVYSESIDTIDPGYYTFSHEAEDLYFVKLVADPRGGDTYTATKITITKDGVETGFISGGDLAFHPLSASPQDATFYTVSTAGILYKYTVNFGKATAVMTEIGEITMKDGTKLPYAELSSIPVEKVRTGLAFDGDGMLYITFLAHGIYQVNLINMVPVLDSAELKSTQYVDLLTSGVSTAKCPFSAIGDLPTVIPSNLH